MIARKWISFLAALSLSPVAIGANGDGISLAHFEPLERFNVQAGGGLAWQKPGAMGPIEVRFDAFGRAFELQLEPNANLLKAMSDGAKFGDLVPYRGRIKGVENSWARIVMIDGMPAGLMFDGTNTYALEVPGDSIVETGAPIVYRLSDVVIAPGALSCAAGSMPTTAEAVLGDIVADVGGVVSQAPGAVSVMSIGMVADFEATSAKGANIDSAIMTRMNNVDVIYSEQIGVQIDYPIIDSFTDINDPFSDTDVPSELLNDVVLYRSGNPAQRSQGLTHLYTGRDLQGTTAGIAYVDVLCLPNVGAGLSEISTSSAIDSLIAAHEIGHNFGAEHDGEAGKPCESEPLTYIMAPSVNPANNTFSACSASIMQANAAQASCVTALPSTDISLSFRAASLTEFLGNTINVPVDVINNGTEIAQNVVVDMNLPGNVSFVSATAGAIICTNGAGVVNCPLGDVAGGSATTIDLTVTAAIVGTDSFDASVTADADDRPGNNQDLLQLTVDPAVNLVVNAPASAQVDLDQSTMLTATFDNQSTLDATGVTLTISLNAGLRANSASWSIGSCSVTAQLVTCQAGRFGSQSSSTLSLNVTGIAEGNKNYTVALASVEADADPTDNTVQGTVRVRSPNGGGGDGGGSLGWLFLLMLGWGAALARQR